MFMHNYRDFGSHCDVTSDLTVTSLKFSVKIDNFHVLKVLRLVQKPTTSFTTFRVTWHPFFLLVKYWLAFNYSKMRFVNWCLWLFSCKQTMWVEPKKEKKSNHVQVSHLFISASRKVLAGLGVTAFLWSPCMYRYVTSCKHLVAACSNPVPLWISRCLIYQTKIKPCRTWSY